MGQQQQRHKRGLPSWKISRVAKRVLEIATWIWTVVIIGLLLEILPTYLFATGTKGMAWGFMISWFRDSQLGFPQNVLRTLVEIAALSLLVITLLAWVVKRSMQDANPDGSENVFHCP